MGERMECPVCKSYGSNVLADFTDERECRYCQTSHESILNFLAIEQKKKFYQSQKIQNEIILENENLKKELEIKRDRYNKLKDFVWTSYYRLEQTTNELNDMYMKRIKDWDSE